MPHGEARLTSAPLRALAFSFGLRQGFKTLTPQIERGSASFTAGVLRGLFDADGSVQGSQEKGVSVRLAQSNLALLESAQRMLLRLGIASTIYPVRRAAGPRSLPDGRGGHRLYDCKDFHELVVSGENLALYADHIGFLVIIPSSPLRVPL